MIYISLYVLARYSRAGFSFALKHGMVLVRFNLKDQRSYVFKIIFFEFVEDVLY